MASDAVLELTNDNFETEVLKSSTPVLVDFWAEWCQPCLMLGPTIDALATEYKGKVKVGKVNTDKNQNTAVKYGIVNIPTVILFKDGQVVQKFVGQRHKNEYKQELDKVAGAATA